MEPPSGSKKQTQTNPVLSAVEWANFKPDGRQPHELARTSVDKAGKHRRTIFDIEKSPDIKGE